MTCLPCGGCLWPRWLTPRSVGGDARSRMTRSHCEVMADMDILTDAEGIGGSYPICDRCRKEMVRDCRCPEDEDDEY